VHSNKWFGPQQSLLRRVRKCDRSQYRVASALVVSNCDDFKRLVHTNTRGSRPTRCKELWKCLRPVTCCMSTPANCAAFVSASVPVSPFHAYDIAKTLQVLVCYGIYVKRFRPAPAVWPSRHRFAAAERKTVFSITSSSLLLREK
jgi:hypothetical protein